VLDSQPNMQRPLVFCLTPVRNEAWTLERFVKCASIWADHIIIADQGSTDGSREIAQKFPKVTMIDNTSKEFNEPERQQMLIAEARRTPGPKVLLALDADEFLTANFLESAEWESITNALPGTVIRFQWPQIEANVSDLRFFNLPYEVPFGFVDDGSEHAGKSIHSNRVPVPPGSPVLALAQIKVMHYCLLDRNRFKSRIRWYQCFEYLTSKKKPIELYRYYHPYLFMSADMRPVPKEWIQGYEERAIDMSSVNREGVYRWDKEVLQYFEKYGLAEFRRLAIWDVDWSKIYHDAYPSEATKDFPDPRGRVEKSVHRWLQATQPDFSHYATPSTLRRLRHRAVQKALRLLGW
jgi:glycosyltransferase involved in cell wall biosynthesis